MKLLAALLVFMIAAQPVQAGFCAMDLSGSGGDTPPMQHHPAGDAGDHGCCEPPATEDDTCCGDRLDCGFCTSGVSAVLGSETTSVAPVTPSLLPLSSGAVAPSHSAPPYRPPIDLS